MWLMSSLATDDRWRPANIPASAPPRPGTVASCENSGELGPPERRTCYLEPTVKRYMSLIETTWWLWIIFVGGGIAGTIFLHGAFVALLPISLITFLWFAHIRYDSEGNRRDLL